MYDYFLKFKLAVDQSLIVVAMVILSTMTCLLMMQVIARYVFQAPFFWVEELARLGQIWVVFLVSPLVLKRGEHPGFKAFPKILPLFWKKFVWIFSMLMVVLVGFTIGYYGIILCQTSTFISANGIARYWAILPVVIGCLWSCVEAITKTVAIVKLSEEEARTWKL